MEMEYQKQLEKVKKIIEGNPRGTTIKEISKKIKINRNVVAKYLDVLQIAGQIEMEKIGRSKVYFPATSVPLSSMFDFTSEFLFVIKKDMTAVEINNPFIKYLGIDDKYKIIGKNIKKIPFSKEYPKMTDNIIEALEKQDIQEKNIKLKRKDSKKIDEFKAKFIPTKLKNGGKAVTVILSKVVK